ncbi:hypothetical protein ACRRTK_020459 [Alexandromys fortis]
MPQPYGKCDSPFQLVRYMHNKRHSHCRATCLASTHLLEISGGRCGWMESPSFS